MIRTRSERLGVLLCVIALTASSAPVAAKDFLLAGVKPDKLVLVDAAARKVERTYTLRDGAPGPAFIVRKYCVVKVAVYVALLIAVTVCDVAPPSLQEPQTY